MDLVTAADLGMVAIDRMVRDRVVLHLAPGFAVPLDLPVTVEDRVMCVVAAVPCHTVVSGHAGLWLALGGQRPLSLTLVGRRGLHRTPLDAQLFGWRTAFHSGPAAHESCSFTGGVRIASIERCVADALRWDDLARAFPACIAAIREGYADQRQIRRMVNSADAKGTGSARAISAWVALSGLSTIRACN